MDKLDKLQVWVSPITRRVYAGYVSGNTATNKVDITEQAISAVAEHLDLESCKYEMGAGTLMLDKSNTVSQREVTEESAVASEPTI